MVEETSSDDFYVGGEHNPRILLVSEYFPPRTFGGGELSAYELAKGLSGKGLDVSVLTSKFKGLEGFESRDGFKIYRLMETGENPGSLVSNFKRRKTFPKSEQETLNHFSDKFMLIHCLNNTSIIGCKTNVPSIATLNSYSVFCPKGNLFYKEKNVCSGCSFTKFIGCLLESEYIGKMRLRFYLKYNPFFWITAYRNYLRRNESIENINKFIVVNDLLKEFLLRNKVREENILKIPNLMTVASAGEETQYPLEKGTINITYPGTLDKIKGVDLLIKAFNKLNGRNLRLLIVGEGPERKKLEGLAGRRVRFLGKLDYDLMQYIYKETDVVVVPSRWPEPLSRVLLEATYYGRPIIATNVGGNPEGVVDGRNGFLVNPEVMEIRDRLKQLLSDDALRSQMGGESRKLFTERFSIDLLLEKVINFYGMK